MTFILLHPSEKIVNNFLPWCKTSFVKFTTCILFHKLSQMLNTYERI